VDVLCTDKTGTLTQNKLRLGDPFALSGDRRPRVLTAHSRRAGQCRRHRLAVLGALKDPHALDGYRVVHFQPFDPVHKRTEPRFRATDGTSFRVTKGPQ